MRLLSLGADGTVSLTLFESSKIPPYAILSHRWDQNDQDVTFEDFMSGTALQKSGFRKLRFCADQAERDGLKHWWIDSCCIDRSSSAELSEAITSMFRWYQNAEKCYVYMSDVSWPGHSEDDTLTWEAAFRGSVWFRRGWTLQELLAPPVVEFYSRQGTLLGTRNGNLDLLNEITGIPSAALNGAPLANFSAEERMTWACNRRTTREEDGAYCLLGVFGVSMVPNYGEGEHAFARLRRKIPSLHAARGMLHLTHC